MRSFFRENFNMLKNGRGFFRFELLYKLAGIAVMAPTLLVLLNGSLRLSGLAYLTNDNIFRYLRHPAGILFVLCAVAAVSFNLLVELSALAFYFYAKQQGRLLTARQIFVAGMKVSMGLFHPKNMPMAFFLVLVVPLTSLPLILMYLFTIRVPEFITRYIRGNTPLMAAAVALLAILLVLSLWLLFCVQYFTLEGKSFGEACRASIRLNRGRAMRTAVWLFCWQAMVLGGLLLAYLLFLGAALLISKIFIPGTGAMEVFLSVFQWLNLLALLVGFCVGVPAVATAAGGLYFQLKKEKKEKLAPLKKLDLPRGRAMDARLKWGTMSVLAALAVMNAGYIWPSMDRGTLGVIEGMQKPLITAHRGNSEDAPENTMAAFQSALDAGADMVELDVQQLGDGSLIIMHDSNFQRTTGIDLNVWEADAGMAAEMDAGSWFSEEFAGEPVPTLEEAIVFAKRNGLRLNIELKSSGHESSLAESVVNLIEKYRFEDQCVLTSLQYSLLEQVKELNPDLMTGYILSVAYGPFYSMEAADMFSIRSDFVTPSMVRAIHDNGKRIMVWTVNDEDRMEQMREWRVDNIITNNTLLARSIVDEPNTNSALLLAFEEFFTGDSFSTSAKRFWKAAFRP